MGTVNPCLPSKNSDIMNNFFLMMAIGIFLLKPSIVTSFKLESNINEVNDILKVNYENSPLKHVQKRDANAQLAFLSFAMALLNTIINIISAVNNNNNNNMNVNMNMVQSMNKRRSYEGHLSNEEMSL